MKALTVEAFIPLLFLIWSVFWMFQLFAKILDNILHPKPFIIVRGKGGDDVDGGCGYGYYGSGDWGDGGCGDGDGGDGVVIDNS